MRTVACAFVSLVCLGAATIEPPPAIRAEGVPVIPQELMDELSRYNESRAALLQDWSPERRELLITTRFADVPQFHRVEMPGGARTQLTFGNERVAGARYSPVSGRYFSYIRDVGGSEFY